MFYNFKKKNKFNISFYIFFLFFIIIFIKFSTVHANANTYKVVDLEITKNYDNDFNKEEVIDIAFKKAFEELILRITTTNGEQISKITNLKTIYSLIESFSIVDEKFIDNKYVSKFEKVQNLSHGEHRQLEIAMALATQPHLLLLDEPMAGMGAEEGKKILKILKKLKKRKTILLIEHDMDVVFALADRITVLVYGRAIASGSPQSIKTAERLREAYLGTEGDLDC